MTAQGWAGAVGLGGCELKDRVSFRNDHSVLKLTMVSTGKMLKAIESHTLNGRIV